MGAGGTSLSRVRILAYYQVRYRYTCTVMFFGTLILITGRRFCAGGFGDNGRAGHGNCVQPFVLKYLDNVYKFKYNT